MNHPLNIKNYSVSHLAAVYFSSAEFAVFDNYSGNPIFTIPSKFPVRLDLMVCILCLEGWMRIQLAHSEYTLYPKDFILISEEQIVQLIETSEDFKVEYLCFTSKQITTKEITNSIYINNYLRNYPHHTLPDDKMKQYHSICLHIKSLLSDNKHAYSIPIIQHCLSILLLETCNLLLHKSKQLSTTSRNEEIYNKFIIEVKQHFRSERKLSFYSNKLNLSTKHLSDVIKKQSGIHASRWIEEYTILEAKALLKSTYLSIQQISIELNFATPSHFTAFFRKHTGLSPREYRKF